MSIDEMNTVTKLRCPRCRRVFDSPAGVRLAIPPHTLLARVEVTSAEFAVIHGAITLDCPVSGPVVIDGFDPNDADRGSF